MSEDTKTKEECEFSFYERLAAVQADIKAPKDSYNQFGKYKYRNAEGILAAVKPLLAKHRLVINLTDTIVQIGDRFYLRADATITDGEHTAMSSSYAREPAEKKGMDESQVTGSASSYARKYALCGLLGIDDSSADPDDPANHPDNPATSKRDAKLNAAVQRGISARKADEAKAKPAPQAKTSGEGEATVVPLTDAEIKEAVAACNTHEELKAAWQSMHTRMTPAQAAIFTNRKNAITDKIAEKEIEQVL